MPEGIITIDKIVIINKIVLPSVVWWIDINNVNQPFMRLFEQIQALQIIPFKDKVIDTVCGCGDFLIRVFREDGYMGTKFNIYRLFVFLPYKTVLFVAQMVFDFCKSPDGFIIRMLFPKRLQKSSIR
jgi:hypothetical protein